LNEALTKEYSKLCNDKALTKEYSKLCKLFEG